MATAPDIPWTYSSGLPPSRTIPPYLQGIRHFPFYNWPPSASLQYKAIYHILLTCTKLIAMDRLGSEVWVSASFQIFALTTEGCPRWEGNCLSKRGKYQGEYVRGDVRGKYVLHSRNALKQRTTKNLSHTHWRQSWLLLKPATIPQQSRLSPTRSTVLPVLATDRQQLEFDRLSQVGLWYIIVFNVPLDTADFVCRYGRVCRLSTKSTVLNSI